MKSLLCKVTVILVLLLCFVSLFGCARQETPPSPGLYPAAPVPQGKNIAPGAETSASDRTSSGSGASSIERKIVRTGNITLVVNNIADAIPQISSMAVEMGGYVVSSNVFEGEGSLNGYISIRVPAQRFDEALARLRKMAVKVPNESTSSQDVTEEYIDLKARLSNLEATEAQYLELLKKAQTVEEILKVQQALSSVRGQIEQTKGRIQYLERTSDMSFIEVRLQEAASFHEKGKWDVLEVLKAAVRGLVSFGKVLVNIIIWLVVFIPLWAVIGAIVWAVIRFKRKRKKAQN